MRRFLLGTLQGTAKLILLGCASLVGLNSLAFSLTVAPTLFPVHEGDKGGYIDRTGRVVIPLRYDGVSDFSEGFAAVEIDGKWGYINKRGKIVIRPQFSSARDFSEGLARIQVGGDKYSMGGLWGFIDRSGKIVIKPQFGEIHGFSESAEGFRDGLAVVEIDWSIGFIDKTGKLAISPRFAFGHHFSEGVACLSTGLHEKYGCINHSGKWVIPQIYDDLSAFSEGWAPGKIHADLSTTEERLF
jgi:hypothetical protein